MPLKAVRLKSCVPASRRQALACGGVSTPELRAAVPRIKSAKKALRQSIKRAAHNKRQRSALKTAVKRARAETNPETVLSAVRALDRGARKGQIHPNTAARKKS